jgi:O-antigen/teichoic acid export membrane protein
MNFGLNYQANTLISIVNGAVLPVFVGMTSGARVVGLVTWAGGIRQAGLAPLEVSQKLIFSAVARTQDNPRFLKRLLEKLLELTCMSAFPLLTAIFALAPAFTVVVYTSKWLPGLTALYLSLIQGVFVLYGVVLMDALLALGKARTVRNITFMWASLQWLLTVPLVLWWDFNGAVLAGLIVSATFFVPLAELRKKVDIDIWSPSLPYLGYSIVSGVGMFVLSHFVRMDSLYSLLLVGFAGAASYLALLLSLRRREVLDNWYTFRRLVFTNTYAQN